MKVALITGISGQDGSYLAELLLEKGYEVHGTIRRSSTINNSRIDHLSDNVILHHADLTDSTNILNLIKNVEPTEIYNLAAQSHVKVSFEMPAYTAEVDALGATRLLHSLCILGLEKDFGGSVVLFGGDDQDVKRRIAAWNEAKSKENQNIGHLPWHAACRDRIRAALRGLCEGQLDRV